MNLATRIASQAAAKQVFVGEDLVRGSSRRSGEFDLKGIARPVTLYEAVRDGPG